MSRNFQQLCLKDGRNFFTLSKHLKAGPKHVFNSGWSSPKHANKHHIITTRSNECQGSKCQECWGARRSHLEKALKGGLPRRPLAVFVKWIELGKCVCLLLLGQLSPQPKLTETQELQKSVNVTQGPLVSFSGSSTSGIHRQGQSLEHAPEALPGHGSRPGKWKCHWDRFETASKFRGDRVGVHRCERPLQREDKHQVTDLTWNNRKHVCGADRRKKEKVLCERMEKWVKIRF